jgi:hypothetical protein
VTDTPCQTATTQEVENAIPKHGVTDSPRQTGPHSTQEVEDATPKPGATDTPCQTETLTAKTKLTHQKVMTINELTKEAKTKKKLTQRSNDKILQSPFRTSTLPVEQC